MKTRTKLANSLAGRIAALAVAEGPNRTLYPGVTIYRLSASQPPVPTLYEAGLIIVGQGLKRGYLGKEIYEYNSGNYLVMISPIPMLCETVAGDRTPVLTMVIEIELPLLGELILETDDAPPPAPLEPQHRGVYAAPLNEPIVNAAARLLDCLTDERSTRVLARQTIREILFHVLQGPRSGLLRMLALKDSRAAQLSRVVRHMHVHYAQAMKMEELAEMARMSVPSFHEHFKVFTSLTPLQYLKTVRLTQARLLMVQAGLPANVTARQVGYESDSQFSREFRRFFGAPPLAEVEKSRASIGPKHRTPPATAT